MIQTFHVPQPCHESWNGMTPADQGRHCAACCKTVIDFSNWEAREIEAYLLTNRTKEVCGRLREDQVSPARITPSAYLYHVMQSGLDFLKKAAAILLFALCIAPTAHAQQPVPQDTVKPMIMGKMIAPPKQPLKRPKVIRKPVQQQHVTGLIASPHSLPVQSRPSAEPE